MAQTTSIQWCDSTVNPIMGCHGCELFPKPTTILNELDKRLRAVESDLPWEGAEQLFARLISTTYRSISKENRHPGHSDSITTTNIHHLRNDFLAEVKRDKGAEAHKAAEEVLARQITCYAAKLHLNKGLSIKNATRNTNRGYAPTFETLTHYPERLEAVAKYRDLLGACHPGEPWKDNLARMVFVSDMGDAFSRESDFEFLEEKVVPHFTSDTGKRHLWLWLTKRPRIMAAFANKIGGFPENVCAMTTLTSGSPDNLKRLVDLKEVKASVRGLSVEPLWERIPPRDLDLKGIDWVIVGGESGSGLQYTRPFQLEWAEELRDHCRKHGVAFFMKQLGQNPIWKGKPIRLGDSHGGEWDEWPDASLKIREFPKYFHNYRKTELKRSSGVRPVSGGPQAQASQYQKLTPRESTEFKRLHKVVVAGLAKIEELGSALMTIKEKRLYRARYATFQEYCDAVLSITRQHAYRLIQAEAFKTRVNTLLKEKKLPLIENERHVRELKGLSDDKVIEVIAEVTQDSQKDSKKDGPPAAIPHHLLKQTADKYRPASAPPVKALPAATSKTSPPQLPAIQSALQEAVQAIDANDSVKARILLEDLIKQLG